MSADTGVDSAAPNLNLAPEEKRVYGQLFRQADTDGVGVVTGEIAVKFFDKTRLDSRVLGEIWQIADKENRGFLTPVGFGLVLRLIGHAQAGREPTAELALQQGPIPRFDGFFPPTAVSSPPPPAPIQAQGSGGAVRIPPLTPDKVAQYSSLFERQSLQGGMLPGELAREIFDKSGLPNETLGKIWGLADTEQRGALVQPEFVIAMHLLTSMKTGSLRGLPNNLPAALYEAATARTPAPRQSPGGGGMSALPRQMSGSAQPRTGSPLGRPPMPAQATAARDWAVTATDKARFDQIYADIDKTNKGYITGEEAVPFFGQSGLPEDTLAQVWDLADFTSQGFLTREGFAVAMYLIRQQRTGRSTTLPATLPANLIPPTMRNQVRAPPASSAFDPPPMTQPPPPQPKSALDDLFGLESGTSSPAPAAPTQTTMSTGGSNMNDPFAGGASVLSPSSPVMSSPTGNTFKPFIPSSSFGRGLSTQQSSESTGTTPRPGHQHALSEDLLADHDPEASKKITGETTELANLSNQVGSLSKQMQDVQSKRTTTQTELNQTNSQKQNFEQRLSQLRALYEKEAQDAHALEEQLRNSRSATKKLQGECMTLEGTYRDTQTQHQEVLTALQADQQENTTLRERIRVVNAEIAQLKPKIDKLKLEGRQQKGLVAINKKQLSTTEGEREKLKAEAQDLTNKSVEDLSRQANNGSPASASIPVASPALSTASGTNPFFKRTASTDIMGVFASPMPRTLSSDKSFDDVFGPSAPAGSTATPPPAAPFKPQTTGASTASVDSFPSVPASTTPTLSRQATMNAAPPPPPESRQISSSFLPFPDQTDSLSSSRQVSPPGSRAEGSVPDISTPLPGDAGSTADSSSVPGAFPSDDGAKDDTPSATPAPSESQEPVAPTTLPKSPSAEPGAVGATDPFASNDHDKAKADFDNAFAAFTSSKGQSSAAAEPAKGAPGFDSEFPPISELERDDESESESEHSGFDDDFAPKAAQTKPDEAPNATGTDGASSSHTAEEDTEEEAPAVPAKETALAPQSAAKSPEQPSSPATITNITNTAMPASTADDIFGSAPVASEPPASQAALPTLPTKNTFDDLDDEFEGLEDAKEGSADDDFANISRDDFNPVFDSSPPASQTKSDSTAFGNESSFDFVSANSATGGPAPTSSNQQKGTDSHDWDAIFAGLDTPGTVTPPGVGAAAAAPTTEAAGAEAKAEVPTRPPGVGRALTEKGEHDDPILKNLTGMGYTRSAALLALEKYDYNLERAANYLASQS